MSSSRVRAAGLALLFSVAASVRAAAQEEGQRWSEVELQPFEGARRPGVRSQLVPVQAGELVYVASALRLFALDARTLEPRWRAGPPRGWHGLEEEQRAALLGGIDHELAWTMPGVGERAVVALLQLPFSRGKDEARYGQVVSRALPERRLFAYERETGKRLWDHAPASAKAARSGASGQRMNVIGPPLVVGERVLVACASDESSIDYRVAAYELASGDLAWTTFVLRGQVERNGLGQLTGEFSAPPLVLAPDGHVLVLTACGALAVLSATTGELTWSTRYPAEPLPRVHTVMPPRRTVRWRSTPPVVVGDVVLAAPMDSRALLAFDLADGRLLWSLPDVEETALPFRKLKSDHLIGAEADTLYLGGPELAAIRCVGGLRAPSSWELVYAAPVGTTPGARARLANGTLLVPDGARLHEIDARTGAERRSRAADATLGLLVQDTALFAVGAGSLERLQP